ncbi:hypothetical protein EDF74_2706 [Stenotrophomonas rhizophila]|uniref:hypothetical protein n=1 Tax=Stenotrophomonas rhizophila TaxID=216778 RepID=UPI000F4B50E2|nr:hypothetical protein [Stenotrophomonas rhizophila]ROP77045.1 hypothetical protein EDF74_2706 [Stenotrophomonas rhizophila]
MRLPLLAALLLTALPAFAQELRIPPVDYPVLPAHATRAEGFVPSGWRIEQQLRGDLNGDKREDLVLVLRQQDPRNIVEHDGFGISPLDSNPRMLAIAWATPDGYSLAAQNHTLITRHEAPNLSDVFEEGAGVSIVRGTLQTTLFFFSNAGSWSTGSASYTFRWQAGAFALIGYDRSSMMRNSGQTESLSINYSTRRVRHAEGSMESDEERVRWETLSSPQRWTLETVGDGSAFEPLASAQDR